MALKNDGTRLFDWNGNMLEPSVTSFARAEKRLKAKKEALDDMQNEYDLLEQQAFRLYKEHVNYMFLGPDLIKKTKAWLSMKKSGKDADGNKLDGRKKYEEKDLAEYFFSRIQEYLGLDDFEPLELIDYNFSQAEDVLFMSHGHKWCLEIPYLNNLHLDHYKRYGATCFKLSLRHYDSDHCTSFFGSTFDEDELKQLMADGIEKYCTAEVE